MADDDIDVEGEFNFKLEADAGLYDVNELPSKSANLLPEFTNPPWMLEQGWSLDNGMDEKSKATIEKMLLEEQYIKGRKTSQYLGINKSMLLITASSSQARKGHVSISKRPWTEEEKKVFVQGLEQFGHSWTKISQLIPSRSTMQVKNYAQQFLKNKAKKKVQTLQESTVTVSDTVSSDAAAATILSHPAGAATTAATMPLLDTEAVVSTARPTITARPHTYTRSKPKSVKRKTLPVKNKVKARVAAGMGSKAVQDRSHQHSTFVIRNGLLSESNSVSDGSSSDMKEEANQENVAGNVCSSVLGSKTETLPVAKDRGSGSESEEVDIDIENDDEGENAILQGRSASPSSVYNKLLEQASVEEGHDLTSIAQEQSCMEDKVQTADDQPVNGTEEISNGTVESDDYLIQNSDAGLSTSMNSEIGEVALHGANEQQEHLVDMRFEEEQELKHIVNGVTASSGEVFEFPIPIEDKELPVDSIMDEEKMVHSEFFDGRPLKTPERYLKIRNYILDCWKKSRPKYLNKTSVRPGLKNCGDVNCIGRIHAYLECIGAINFGCEQTAYNNPGRGASTFARNKHSGRDSHHPGLLTSKIDTVRPRKRRIRDASGHWVDEKELEGKTIEHKPEEENAGPAKSSKGSKVVYDPFKLVPCQLFTEDKQAPFTLEVMSTALAVMDIHSHISRTEVIGLLGGQFDGGSSCLTISMAIPCKSISTGMQCEMDPVSQTHASEQIEDVGMRVVGWYHSHPTFAPNPSVRDIETQQKFQYWFAKGGSHFVGLIISPYSPQNTSVVSEIRCLTIGDDVAQQYLCNTPYQFSYKVIYRDNMREILGPASELAEKYSTYNSRVALSCIYKVSLGITCLSKMLQSVKHRLEPPEEEHPIRNSRRKVEDILHWLEQIFVDKFSSAGTAPVTDVQMAPMTTTVPPTDEEVQV